MNVQVSWLCSRADARASAARSTRSRALCQRHALTFAALLGSLWSVASAAEAQQTPKRVDQAPAAPSAAPAAETAPIDKFDLADALMAETGGLTADDAGKRARARAPQIMAARASATASRTDQEAGWQTFIPLIDLSAGYKRVSDPKNVFVVPSTEPVPPGMQVETNTFNPPLNQWALSANAQWAVSDIFLRALPSYKATVGFADAQKIQVEVSEQTVDLNARNAFYEYARALAQRAVTEQAVKQAQAQADQIKLFVDAGTAAQVDHMTSIARLEEARSAFATSVGRVAISQSNLATLTGMQRSEINGLSEPVLDSPQAPNTQEAELVKTAFERRAELRALRKLVEANERTKSAQLGGAMPSLVVTGGDLYGLPNPRKFPPNKKSDGWFNTWEVGVALNWRVNNSITGNYAVHKAEANVAKARADLGAQEDAIRMEVVTAIENFKAAQAVTSASESRLKAAEEAYRVRLATYRVGAGVIVDLLDADLAVSQARLALANSAINTRAALAALNRAVSLDTP
jgi:outer membrane protein TolC